MRSNDWKQIDTICLVKLPLAWNTGFTTQLCMCYVITRKVKNYSPRFSLFSPTGDTELWIIVTWIYYSFTDKV